MNATTSPRFTSSTMRGNELSLAEPLPPTLAAHPEVAKRVEQHREVGAALVASRERLIDAVRHLESVKAAHEQKVEAAIIAGKSPPPPRSGTKAEQSVTEAERDVVRHEKALPKSSKLLRAYAAPYLEDAVASVAEEQERTLVSARELLAALDSTLARLQSLPDEAEWLEAAIAAKANGHDPEPYRDRGGDSLIAQLRATLRREFDECLDKREKLAAKVERLRAVELEAEAERRRHEEQARRDDANRRVVTEDGRVVERGGRPVRQTPFGLTETDDEVGDRGAAEFQSGKGAP
jgi:hypothetical protein